MMCTVDGSLPATNSFAGCWQGDESLPSRHSWQQLQDEKSSQSDTFSLLNAKLLLSDDFEELEVHSRVYIASVKLFLTDTHIIVATDQCSGSSDQPSYLRAHLIKEIDIELDQEQPTMIFLTSQTGRFLYFIRNGASRIAYWMNCVFRLKRDGVISSSPSIESTMDERTKQQQQQHPLSSSSVVQSVEGPSPPSSSLPSTPSRQHVSLSSDTSSHDVRTVKSSSLKRGSGLRRRMAFRNSDFGPFRERSRSSSVPAENLDTQETTLAELNLDLTSISNNEKCDRDQHQDNDDDSFLSQVDSTHVFESPSRHSSLRKGKLKISPRANKFTRALSARLNNSSSNSSLSSTPTPEVRRAKSLNNSSSTLPRPKRNHKKELRATKSKSTVFDSSTPPVTPTKMPKSPGSLLKRFNRRTGTSSLNLENFLLSMEESDISTVDVQNKPKQLKLYLQPPLQIAEELTLMNAEMFHEIDQKELENGAWTKKTKHSTSPNILKMIESFNRLARIVCTEIVHEKTASSRGKAISNYIKIISKLYQLHNYDSMKAIVSGLQSQAVYRLKRSWSHVPTRRRKKYDKFCEFLSNIDSNEGFKEHMRYNFENNIQCIPYLGWLLTYTLHYQTLKKFQEDGSNAKVSFRRHRTSSVSFPNSKKLFRESVCSLSLPNSPPESETGDDDSSEFQSVITNFSAEVLHFTKSLSDSNVQQYTSSTPPCLPTPDRSSSPQDEIDFEYPNQLHPLHPLSGKVIVNPAVDSHSRDSSSDSSIQSDSGIMKSVEMCTSPQQQQTKEEYALPPIDHNDDDNDDRLFDGSFTARPSVCSRASSSPSCSIISPSMVSFNLVSEPNTPHKEANQSRLMSICYHQYTAAVTDHNSGVLCIPSCGILFSCIHSSEDMVDLVRIPYHHAEDDHGVPMTDIIKQVRELFSTPTERDPLVKFKTPTLSVNDEIVDDIDLVMLPHTPPLGKVEDRHTPPPVMNDLLDDDSVFMQYQRNSLCYSCELTSRQHMRYLINKVPWLDENQCHQVSVEVEPST